MSWENWEASPEHILDVLKLEKKAVYRRAEAADACLDYYKSTGDSPFSAGSMAVLSASCWSLIDTVVGRNRWQQAADIYAQLDHPYALILSVCAGRTGDQGTVIRQNSLDFSCQLLQLAWLSVTVSHSVDSCRAKVNAFNALAERIGAHSSGQLLLPSSYVYEFSSAIVHDWPEHGITARLAVTAKRLLTRAAAGVHSAQSDRYHWRRILPGFMPVEPEWLSIGRIAYEAVVRSSGNGEILSADLTDLENIPMQIAARMPPPGNEGTFDPASPYPSRDSGDLSSLREDGMDDS